MRGQLLADRLRESNARISQGLTWAGAITNGGALIAATNVIGNVQRPDEAFAFLMPSMAVFALGVALNGIGALITNFYYDRLLSVADKLYPAFQQIEELKAQIAEGVPDADSELQHELLRQRAAAKLTVKELRAIQSRTWRVRVAEALTAVSLFAFGAGCLTVGVQHAMGGRLQPAAVATGNDQGADFQERSAAAISPTARSTSRLSPST